MPLSSMLGDHPALVFVAGLAMLLAAGLVSAPSRPMAARTDAAALLALAGAIAVIVGVHGLKRRNDESRRRRD